MSSSLEPHVMQNPQRLRAAGLPALPSRPISSHPRDSKAACLALTTSPALAVPSTPYGTQPLGLWRPAGNGANMTTVLTWAPRLISGIHREASHTAFFKDCSVNHVMLADLNILSAADHRRMAHARQCARQATSAAAAADYAYNDPCSPYSAFSSQLRMHRTTWELQGMATTLGALGACTPAHSMRQRCRMAFAPPLHQHAQRQPWWVRLPAQRAKTSGLDECVGTCVHAHTTAVKWAVWAAPHTGSPYTRQVGCRYP